jgi:hypothetical protein
VLDLLAQHAHKSLHIRTDHAIIGAGCRPTIAAPAYPAADPTAKTAETAARPPKFEAAANPHGARR